MVFQNPPFFRTFPPVFGSDVELVFLRLWREWVFYGIGYSDPMSGAVGFFRCLLRYRLLVPERVFILNYFREPGRLNLSLLVIT